MKNILIVNGHTYMNKSIANKRVMDILKEKYPNAVINELVSLYPDYRINVEKEKQKLIHADTIIIQSPLFWFSLTSLVMRWIEEVFTHGFAYGSEGCALEGKKVIVGITAGSSNEDYSNGKVGISIDEIIKTLEVTFKFCKMDFLGTVFTGSMFNTGNSTQEEILNMEKLAEKHCNDIFKFIQ